MEVILQHVGAHLVGALAAAAPAAQPTLAEQVGRLLLGSVPTALLFLVVVIAYEVLVQGPLTATLARRRALTEGAREEAQHAIARAEARTAEYAEKLRLARVEAYKLREQRVKQWNADRDAALEAARHSAGEKVSQTKAALESEAASARQTIEAMAADLGRQAVRAVLTVAAGGSR
jgi:F-type H+-transporting ATPase subunit b